MEFDRLVANSMIGIAGIMILWIVTGLFSLHLGIYPGGYSRIDLILLIVLSAAYQPIAYTTYKNWEHRNSEEDK